MAFKPNRPIRVGTKMMLTDATGKVPRVTKGEASEDQKKPLPDLAPMTKAQLIETAKGEGVTFESDDNKASLVAKIEQARR